MIPSINATGVKSKTSVLQIAATATSLKEKTNGRFYLASSDEYAVGGEIGDKEANPVEEV